MVVEEPRDLWAIEKTGQYNGLYHILQGRISPLDNVGPADLRIRQLIGRLKKERIRELVIATTPTREGDTTANYIAEKVRPLGIPMTRLASGIPVGGDLEYADQVTLSCAIKGRVTI
jgi:recombination protein RecR